MDKADLVVSIGFTVLTTLPPRHVRNVFPRMDFYALRNGTCVFITGHGRTTQATKEGYVKSILDPSFRYTRSVDTDLRKTFARVRREQRRQQNVGENDSAKVVLIKQQGRFGGR